MAATRIGAGLSTDSDTGRAADEAAAAAAGLLAGRDPDLAVVFASHAHLGALDRALETIGARLDPAHLIGCCAQGVVGTGREVERGPGISVWAAALPGTAIDSFHLTAADLEQGWRAEDMVDPNGSDVALLLADPLTFPIDRMLELLRGTPVVGGMASGRRAAEDSTLLLGREVLDDGAVGTVLGGASVRACVSQGAAPVGPEMVVTAAEGNVVFELASKPALEKLREVLMQLDAREREMAQSGLLIGVVIDENKPDYGRGDFLIRTIIGIDEERGAVAVGDRPRIGQTVRLHVRDAASADADLREALKRELASGAAPNGALLFTCNGRGGNMFPQPDHDAAALAAAFGPAPVAGFFCAGEIGPVGGRNFLHGFTATMALFD